MRRILFLILAVFLTVGCHKVFEPELEDVEPFLVVEGRITTRPGSNYIFMHNTMPYTEYPYYEGQTGAVVWLEKEDGSYIHFEDKGNGGYKLTFTEDDVPQVGDTYVLRILTSEGDEYASTPQVIVPSPEISGLFCEHENSTILTEDAYGGPLEVELSGMNIIHEANGILPANNFYNYDYVAYEQHHTSIKIGINVYHLYRHRRLSGRYSSNIHTVSADEYGDFRVRNEKIMFISRDDMTKYLPKVADTIEILGTVFEGLIFKLNQYSLSPDAYNFYESVEDQLAAEGRMFDPASPQVVGNISCISDSTKQVIGIFAASDVAERYAYFHINYRGLTNSMEIDSIPELWLDTCSWGKPESWINPPF